MAKEGLITIRKAGLVDVDNLRNCAKLAFSKYIERIKREPAPMNADFVRRVEEGRVYIGLHDHAFAGYIIFYSVDNHLHLENLAVMPELAGQGIGGVLIEFAECMGRERGLVSIELYTNEVMVENMQIYAKLGYKEVERREEDGFYRVYFSKSLR